MAESFRSGLESVDIQTYNVRVRVKHRCLAYTKASQIMKNIIIPQAMSIIPVTMKQQFSPKDYTLEHYFPVVMRWETSVFSAVALVVVFDNT